LYYYLLAEVILFLFFQGWILAIPLLLALLCSKIAATEINDSIILKFLKNNLSGNDA